MFRLVLPFLALLLTSPVHASGWRACQRAVVWAVSGYDTGRALRPFEPADPPIDFGRVSSLTPGEDRTALRDPYFRAWRLNQEPTEVVLEKSVRTVLQFADPVTSPSAAYPDQDFLFGELTGYEDRAFEHARDYFRRIMSGENSLSSTALRDGQPVKLIQIEDAGHKRVGLSIAIQRTPDDGLALAFRRHANTSADYLWLRLKRDVFSNRDPVPLALQPVVAVVPSAGMTLPDLISRMETGVERNLSSTLAFDSDAVEKRALDYLKREAMRAFFEQSVPAHPFKRAVGTRLWSESFIPSSLPGLLTFIDDTPGWTAWGRHKAELKRLVTETWREMFYAWRLQTKIVLRVVAESADGVRLSVGTEVPAHRIRLSRDGTFAFDGVVLPAGDHLRVEVVPQTPLAVNQPTVEQVQTLALKVKEELEGL